MSAMQKLPARIMLSFQQCQQMWNKYHDCMRNHAVHLLFCVDQYLDVIYILVVTRRRRLTNFY